MCLTRVELTKRQEVEKKHGDAEKRKLVDGQNSGFSVSERGRRTRGFTAAGRTGEKENHYILAPVVDWCCFSFLSVFSLVWILLKLDTCKDAKLVWFEQQQSFPTGRERKQMKMLEICLKLVGCKSKKGLSSSSSCYLEGKKILWWRLPHPSAGALIFLLYCTEIWTNSELRCSKGESKGCKADTNFTV